MSSATLPVVSGLSNDRLLRSLRTSLCLVPPVSSSCESRLSCRGVWADRYLCVVLSPFFSSCGSHRMYVMSTSSAPPVAEGFGRGIPAGLFCTRRRDKVCQEQEDRGRKTQAEARTGSAVEAGVELAPRFVTCRTVVPYYL